MRKADIALLLEDVEQNIFLIESERQKAVNDSTIQAILKPRVKSCLEHLRSCLDYCAKDVYTTVIDTNPKKRVYFPYGEQYEKFKSNLDKNIGNLEKTNKDIYDLIESIQPFRTGDNWLLVLCNATNENKHSQLISQNRVDRVNLEQDGYTYISFPKGLKININNCSFGDTSIESLEITDGKASSSINDTNLNLINWTDFMFYDFNVSVIDFLKKAHCSISKFQENLYNILKE